MAADAGTAVGSGRGCQAHARTNRLPRGSSPQLSSRVRASARPWQGWRRAYSMLMVGTPEWAANARTTSSLRASAQVSALGKARTATASP